MKIEELIISMKKRPQMFVKEERIDYFYYFLSGYCGANNRLLGDDMDQKFCLWFSKWLILWINQYIDAEYLPKTAYWYDDIKAIAKTEQDEIRIFFDLCNSFFEDYRNGRGYFSCRH